MLKERLMLLGFCILAFISTILISSEIYKIAILGMISIMSTVILFKNLVKLTGVSEENPKINVMKRSSIFCITLLLCGFVYIFIDSQFHFTILQEKYIKGSFLIITMLYLGNLAPQVPFNKHIGLRLPWTVLDEESWIIANRLLGYLSVPLATIYLVLLPISNDGIQLTMYIMFAWIGIPGIVSFVRLFVKYRNRN